MLIYKFFAVFSVAVCQHLMIVCCRLSTFDDCFTDVNPLVLCFRVKFYPPDPMVTKEEITRYVIITWCRSTRYCLVFKFYKRPQFGPSALVSTPPTPPMPPMSPMPPTEHMREHKLNTRWFQDLFNHHSHTHTLVLEFHFLCILLHSEVCVKWWQASRRFWRSLATRFGAARPHRLLTKFFWVTTLFFESRLENVDIH